MMGVVGVLGMYRPTDEGVIVGAAIFLVTDNGGDGTNGLIEATRGSLDAGEDTGVPEICLAGGSGFPGDFTDDAAETGCSSSASASDIY